MPRAHDGEGVPAAGSSRRVWAPDRRWWRRAFRFGLPLVLVVTALSVIWSIGDRSRGGALDPRSARQEGTLAIASLLRGRGVTVRHTTDAKALDSTAGGPGDTAGRPRVVVVAYPERLTHAQLAVLRTAAAGGNDVVLLDASTEVIAAVGLAAPAGEANGTSDANDTGDTGDGSSTVLPPGCSLPEAVIAGRADVGAVGYRNGAAPPRGWQGSRCYRDGQRAAVVVLSAPASGDRSGRLVLMAGHILMNRSLAREGNAALALGLLSRDSGVTWLVAQPGQADSVAADRGLAALVPDRVVIALVQLGLAVVVLALWRGRRLGPPVPEPLPVVVRAAETVEGRGRLYAAGAARGLAAAALRRGTRLRLAAGTGIAGGSGLAGEPNRAALLAAVSAASGRSEADLAMLLYGSDAAPGAFGGRPGTPTDGGAEDGSDRGSDRGSDDDALVRLAAALRDAERGVAARSAANTPAANTPAASAPAASTSAASTSAASTSAGADRPAPSATPPEAPRPEPTGRRK